MLCRLIPRASIFKPWGSRIIAFHSLILSSLSEAPFVGWLVQGAMESANGLTNLKPCVPRIPSSSASYSDSSPKGSLKSLDGLNHHHRCSSESFLTDEHPSWLEELLNDSETIFHRGHLRSASDSFAFLGDAEETFGIEESKYVGNPTRSEDMDSIISVEKMGSSLPEMNNQELEEAMSSLAIEQSRDESTDKAICSQVKPSGAKAESKRAKQHNAHRSRVWKLQYIAHLERTVQILKAEGSEVSAELEFIEQQKIILAMENRALRQRLESVSQELMIKQWEQGMLEREIGRLQNLYHVQIQQQQQMQTHQQQQQQQQPHSQHPKPRRNKSRDFDQMRNKEASSSKTSTSNGSFRA